jgi:hypothetical protein
VGCPELMDRASSTARAYPRVVMIPWMEERAPLMAAKLQRCETGARACRFLTDRDPNDPHFPIFEVVRSHSESLTCGEADKAASLDRAAASPGLSASESAK